MTDEEQEPGRERPMTRRDVVVGGGALAAGLAGGVAAGVGIGRATEDGDGAATVGEGATTAPEAAPVFAKAEGTTLKVFGTELGTPWYDQTPFVTPHELFFVRNRYPSPAVDADTWTLKVSGDAIETPLTITYEELRAMPSRTAPRMLECFGNGRTVNREQLGYEVEGGNWGFSAFSQGEWDYVPIKEILDRVKLRSNARQLLFWSGVDGPDTGRPMPMEAVLERPEDIGLAFGLNGLIPLPADHGGPVRALVPGWGGAASVKWLTEIRISSHRFWTRMHTREEALIGDEWPREAFDEDADEFLGATADDIQGQTATWQNTKSFLALPYAYKKSEPPGRYVLQQGEVPKLPAGQRTMRGYANSPFGIEKVEYSVDGGETWQEATLVEPIGLPYSRVRFEFPWNATPGTHVLATRATDKQGNVQPETVPLNKLGILCNAIAKFEVEVT
jgi:DMSO/TMAO reductase YedYZ molybdopterin-dependent catalytic subunit